MFLPRTVTVARSAEKVSMSISPRPVPSSVYPAAAAIFFRST
jgi:hypothetical protein